MSDNIEREPLKWGNQFDPVVKLLPEARIRFIYEAKEELETVKAAQWEQYLDMDNKLTPGQRVGALAEIRKIIQLKSILLGLIESPPPTEEH